MTRLGRIADTHDAAGLDDVEPERLRARDERIGLAARIEPHFRQCLFRAISSMTCIAHLGRHVHRRHVDRRRACEHRRIRRSGLQRTPRAGSPGRRRSPARAKARTALLPYFRRSVEAPMTATRRGIDGSLPLQQYTIVLCAPLDPATGPAVGDHVPGRPRPSGDRRLRRSASTPKPAARWSRAATG